MDLHTLPKIVRRKKRVGRGIGSRGAKSGRGMKGQRSRAGARIRPGFEGGQSPLYMRLPKRRGAKQRFASRVTKPAAVTVAALRVFADQAIVGPKALQEAGLVPARTRKVKLIGAGSLDRKLTVRVHAVTEAAQQAIEQAGGTVELIPTE